MSVFTTINITRRRALELYLQEKGIDLNDVDKILEGFMDEVLEPMLYNCFIVDDNEEDNDNIYVSHL